MIKCGRLCAGQFEPGNAIYWEVRRVTRSAYHVYRTSPGAHNRNVTLEGEYDNPTDAYARFHEHIEPRTPADLSDEEKYGH